MGKYLTALRAEVIGTSSIDQLQELQEGGSYSFCSAQVGTSQKFAAGDHVERDSGAYRCWLIRYPNAPPIQLLFTPTATQAEVSAIYPGAQIEVLPESVEREATPAEAAELVKLLALLLTDANDAERAEALAVALADPDYALTSFRALVNQR